MIHDCILVMMHFIAVGYAYSILGAYPEISITLMGYIAVSVMFDW